MFNLPPTNHFANGSFHSRTLSQRLNQWSASACSAQKDSGSSAARAYSFSYSSKLLISAFEAKSAGGGKSRDSLRTESNVVDSDMAKSINYKSREFKMSLVPKDPREDK